MLKTYRESLDLVIVTVISIALSSFGISVYFLDAIRSLFSNFASLPLIGPGQKFWFIYLVGLLWITFRRWRRAESEKKELEEVISTISPDVLVVADPKGNIVLCTGSMERLFGYTAKEITGKNLDFLYSNNPMSPGDESAMQANLLERGFHVSLAKGKAKGGREIPLEVISRTLKSTRAGSVMLLRDIADLKNLEEKLHAVSREASELVSRVRATVKINDLYSDLTKIMTELTRYVSTPTVEMAERAAAGTEVGTGETVAVTVLFSDIRGYTSFTENMDPSEVFKMLNQYLSVQIKIVEEYHGIIDKLTGDEVMAIFTGPNMARNALECGKAITRALSDPQFQIGKEWIGVGIGVNTGPAYMGSVGSETRKDHTVVGTTVNVAARLCGYARKFQVIFPESTRDLVAGDGLDYRSVGEVNLKGLSAPLEVFELI